YSAPGVKYGSSDCLAIQQVPAGNNLFQTNINPVTPYTTSLNPLQFLNGNGFQIVCAGRERAFGTGGLWNTRSGYGSAQPGSANISNFSQRQLSDPTQ